MDVRQILSEFSLDHLEHNQIITFPPVSVDIMLTIACGILEMQWFLDETLLGIINNANHIVD